MERRKKKSGEKVEKRESTEMEGRYCKDEKVKDKGKRMRAEGNKKDGEEKAG